MVRISVPHILCTWVMSSRASPFVLAALLQNQMKPHTPKWHRSCRVTDSGSAAFSLYQSPQSFQLASSLRGTEKNKSKDHWAFCKFGQGHWNSSLLLGTTLLLNCNKMITQNGFSSLSTSHPEQSIRGLTAFTKKERKCWSLKAVTWGKSWRLKAPSCVPH